MSSNARIFSAISVGVLLVALGLVSIANLSTRSGRSLDSEGLGSNSSVPAIHPGTVAAGKMAGNGTAVYVTMAVSIPAELAGMRR